MVRKRRTIRKIKEPTVINFIYIFSDSSKDQHGRPGQSQEANTEDDDGHCDCLYHLLVPIQFDVSVVSGRGEKENYAGNSWPICFPYRHIFDRNSAESVSHLVQKVLFFFACTNSSMNPIVYGIFNANRNKKKKHEHIIVTQISSLSKRSDRSTCKSI